MKLFKCQACGQDVYFENRFCGACGHALGYLPRAGVMMAVEPQGEHWRAIGGKRQRLRYCANVVPDACNWLIPADQEEEFCAACRHNRTIPDLSVEVNLERWKKMEFAKHRLFYTLIELDLPLKDLKEDPEHGLAFDFLADDPEKKSSVLTGHDAGLITINLNEADDAIREKLRTAMHEPYRTLLGHFRHEVGHHFWDILVRDAGRAEQCREIFGDERQDYGEALKRHYGHGAPADWRNSFISAYATAHPWEDFAETWAHYLHIIDTLETASSFGLRIHPASTRNKALHADIDFNPHYAASLRQIIDAWLPLTFAVNSLNRSMGHADLYPFILSEPVVKKLEFIHDIVQASRVSGPKAAARRKGLFRRTLRGAGQPPAAPPSAPGEPAPRPGRDIPPPVDPIIDPPIDPPYQPPPEESPPDDMPQEIPPPMPDEIPAPMEVG
jgi:hypothetical protein